MASFTPDHDQRTDFERQNDAIYWPIADQLAAEGKNPTQELIRQRSPKGGSYSYIGPSLKRWRRRGGGTALRLVTEELPEEIKMAQTQATTILWKAASTLSNDRIRRIEEQALERIKEAESDGSELLGEVARLEEEIKEREAATKQRDAEIEILKDRLLSLEKTLAGAEATAKAEKAHSEELQDRVDEITKELITVQTEAGKWKEQAQNLTEKLRHAESGLTAAHDASAEVANKLRTAAALADERKLTIEVYDRRFEEQSLRYEQLLEQLRDGKSSAEATAKLSTKEVESLRYQMYELNKSVTESVSKIARAEAQAEEREREALRLRSQVDSLLGASKE